MLSDSPFTPAGMADWVVVALVVVAFWAVPIAGDTGAVPSRVPESPRARTRSMTERPRSQSESAGGHSSPARWPRVHARRMCARDNRAHPQ